MFVLCPECKNHYEDSSQSAECEGVGRPGHRWQQLSALGIHLIATRAMKAIVELKK